MPKFRTKPVVIEARRVPMHGEYVSAVKMAAACVELEEWCGGLSKMFLDGDEASPVEGLGDVYGPHIAIPTLEGPHAARPGDWIIKGVQGEFYPVKPGLFAAIYEPVEDSS